jgi:hypothetical protein
MPPSEPTSDNTAEANPTEVAQTPPKPENGLLPQTETFILPPKRTYKTPFYILLTLILLAAASAGGYWYYKNVYKANKNSVKTSSTQQTTTPSIQGLRLDPNKDYGNKYASGLLPVGDSKDITDKAKTGYVFACNGYAQNLSSNQGGAGSRGPWFANNNTQYDINKKLHVQGSMTWQASFSNKVSGATRTITTNDLPDHTTGVFPISPTDPAYAYDRNPNSIKGQTLTYSLKAGPSYGNPQCMGGEAGIMLTGVALFNAFDAGGRDAGAWEIQDSCSGHPQKDGEYHYHTLSSCIKDISVKTVIGYALDGFPITGPQVGNNNILTTSDLDECHGLSSQVILDGKNVISYHYVMTQDFPYSVSCFRSTPIQPPGSQSGPPAQPQT